MYRKSVLVPDVYAACKLLRQNVELFFNTNNLTLRNQEIVAMLGNQPLNEIAPSPLENPSIPIIGLNAYEVIQIRKDEFAAYYADTMEELFIHERNAMVTGSVVLADLPDNPLLPQVTLQPIGGAIYEEDLFIFSSDATQYTSVQWFKDGELIPLANTLDYVITIADKLLHAGDYVVRFSNDYGYVDSTAATLSITLRTTYVLNPVQAGDGHTTSWTWYYYDSVNGGTVTPSESPEGGTISRIGIGGDNAWFNLMMLPVVADNGGVTDYDVFFPDVGESGTTIRITWGSSSWKNEGGSAEHLAVITYFDANVGNPINVVLTEV